MKLYRFRLKIILYTKNHEAVKLMKTITRSQNWDDRCYNYLMKILKWLLQKLFNNYEQKEAENIGETHMSEFARLPQGR